MGISQRIAPAAAFTALAVGCADDTCPPGSVVGLDGLCHLVDTSPDTSPGPTHGLVVDLDPDFIAHLQTLSPMPAPPPSPSNRVADHPGAVELGRTLFYESRFSKSGELSCASCHAPELAFGDAIPVAFGEELYPRNTNSLINVAYYDWFLWDGGCDAIWCQAPRPLENRHEMNANRMEMAHLVSADPQLAASYEAVFGPLPDLTDHTRFPDTARPDHLDPHGTLNTNWEAMSHTDQVVVNTIFANLAKSLEAYQRTLISTASPFDTFIEGLADQDPTRLSALSPEAQRGLVLFFGKADCVACHDGPLLTSDQFVNVGLDTRPWLLYEDNGRWEAVEDLLEDTFTASGPYSDAPEWGAERVADLEQSPDLQATFRVPSLRNVSRTGPYMHGGHFDTLAEVIQHYNTLDEAVFEGVRDERLVPLGLTDTEVAELEAFLVALELEPAADEQVPAP